MTDLVNPSTIEAIVGADRGATLHRGRAVTTGKKTVYILHSAECLNSGRDLRNCPYSIALDRGITDPYPRMHWRHFQDRPVILRIHYGYLVPDRATPPTPPTTPATLAA